MSTQGIPGELAGPVDVVSVPWPGYPYSTDGPTTWLAALGMVGDGVTDDAPALQAALDRHGFPPELHMTWSADPLDVASFGDEEGDSGPCGQSVTFDTEESRAMDEIDALILAVTSPE